MLIKPFESLLETYNYSVM